MNHARILHFVPVKPTPVSSRERGIQVVFDDQHLIKKLAEDSERAIRQQREQEMQRGARTARDWEELHYLLDLEEHKRRTAVQFFGASEEDYERWMRESYRPRSAEYEFRREHLDLQDRLLRRREKEVIVNWKEEGF